LLPIQRSDPGPSGSDPAEARPDDRLEPGKLPPPAAGRLWGRGHPGADRRGARADGLDGLRVAACPARGPGAGGGRTVPACPARVVLRAFKPDRTRAAEAERIRSIKVSPAVERGGDGAAPGPRAGEGQNGGGPLAPWDRPPGGLALADAKLTAPRPEPARAA